MIGTKIASMLLNNRQLEFYKVQPLLFPCPFVAASLLINLESCNAGRHRIRSV